MSKKIISLLPAAALVLAMAIPAAAASGKVSAKTSPTPSAQPPAAAPSAPPEKHPEIHEAMESLRSAKDHLEHAAHDFGGHRVEAIHAIDEAMHQLQVCMQYDKD